VPTDADAISIRQFFNKQDPLVTEWLQYQAHVRAQEAELAASANKFATTEDISSKFSDAVRRANQDIAPILDDEAVSSITTDCVNDENIAPLDTDVNSTVLKPASIRGALPGEQRIYHQVSDVLYRPHTALVAYDEVCCCSCLCSICRSVLLM
jgi:hypothetical protein